MCILVLFIKVVIQCSNHYNLHSLFRYKKYCCAVWRWIGIVTMLLENVYCFVENILFTSLICATRLKCACYFIVNNQIHFKGITEPAYTFEIELISTTSITHILFNIFLGQWFFIFATTIILLLYSADPLLMSLLFRTIEIYVACSCNSPLPRERKFKASKRWNIYRVQEPDIMEMSLYIIRYLIHLWWKSE